MLIEAVNLSAAYGGQIVFSNVGFALGRHELLYVCGPNGSGKSTLVKVLAALKEPQGGSVHAEARVIAYAAPFFNLPPRLRVSELGSIALRTPQERRSFNSCLAAFALQRHLHFLCAELSSGTAQKIKIALAASRDAGLYLFDDPFVHLDGVSVECCRGIIDECRRRAAAIVTGPYPPAALKNHEKAVSLAADTDCS